MEILMEEAIKCENLDNVILQRRDNNMLLSNYQIDVLNRFGINYLNYADYHGILFDIEEILESEYDDELDLIGSQIAEYIYYNETKK